MTYQQSEQLLKQIYEVYAKMHSHSLHPQKIEMNYKLYRNYCKAIIVKGEELGMKYLIDDPNHAPKDKILGIPMSLSSTKGVRVIGEKQTWEVPNLEAFEVKE